MPNLPIGFLPLPAAGQPVVRPMFRTLGISASGLSAQRQRMEVIATNIANAETTHGPNGQPYRRRTVTMEAAQPDTQSFDAKLFQLQRFGEQPFDAPKVIPFLPSPALPMPDPGDPSANAAGVRVAAVQEDATNQGPLVYEPGHPDADANGYVRYPNVRITDEMIDMMDAKRVYEANATVFQSAKAMLRNAIDI